MNLEIRYEKIDPGAKADSEPRTSDAMPWSDVSDLKFDGIHVKNVMTCEHNQAILDGEMEHLPADPEDDTWGLWSSEMSGDDGVFEHPPTLEVGFSHNIKSPGLTLRFYPHTDDYANSVHVTWYNSSGVAIKSGEYAVDSTIGSIAEDVTDYRRQVIKFLSTNIRRRYVKLMGIDFGLTRVIDDTEIDTARILEEVDPTSNTLSINTLNFRIKTHDPRFSMVSGVGDGMLIINQPITITGDGKNFGLFYMQPPSKDVYGDGTTIEFKCDDAIGIMGQYEFMGGIYSDALVADVLAEIFSVCFPTRSDAFLLDSELSDKTVSGWIPSGTCRRALQLICFAIGAIADDSRREYVWIYPADVEVGHTIPEETIYRGMQIQPTTYYSGVRVISHEYTRGEDAVEAFNGVLAQGDQTIRFSEPLHEINASAGEILESSSNHIRVRIDQPANVIVSGKKYIVNLSDAYAGEDAAAGEVENTIPYENCTLMSPAAAQAAAERLFALHKRRTQIDAPVRVMELEVGESVQVPTIGLPINGLLERLATDLRTGRADMRVVGNVDSGN